MAVTPFHIVSNPPGGGLALVNGEVFLGDTRLNEDGLKMLAEKGYVRLR